jgi:hypothetical protein
MQPNALDPVASERLSHAGKVFTSDLSINEFALLHGAGFEPIELVMGVSVYHVGYQFTGIRQQSELPVLTEATYRAGWNGVIRARANTSSSSPSAPRCDTPPNQAHFGVRTGRHSAATYPDRTCRRCCGRDMRRLLL